MLANVLCSACQRCIAFCWPLRPFEKRTAHHENLESLENSITVGCLLCVKIRDYMTDTLAHDGIDFRNVYDGSNMTRASVKDARLDSLVLMTVMQWKETRLMGTRYDPPLLCFAPCKPSAGGHMCQGKMVNPAPLPVEKTVGSSWNQILSWSTTCTRQHRKCHRGPPGDYFVPTRVVSVEDQGKTARVVMSSSLSRDTQYLSLSYCWGTEPILKLTAATKARLEAGVDVTALPRTYQDAMRIAYQLRMPYLWIDALCIEQDSPADWLRESAVMHHVYGHAVLSICATSAGAAGGGLFEHSPSAVTRSVTTALPFTGSQTPVFLDWVNPWIPLVSRAPVGRRAWIFQERLLSPRILHFTTEQVFWECNELAANERFPDGLDDALYYHPRGNGIDYFSSPVPSSNPQGTTPLDHHHHWNRVLADYSTRHLTYESDKLPALAGLAALFHSRTGLKDTYLAGLWLSTLPAQLLWESEHPLRSSSHDVPSWSPLSHSGKIVLSPPIDIVLLVELVSAMTTLVAPSMKFGQVRDGRVYLKSATLISLSLPDALSSSDVRLPDDVEFTEFAPQPLRFGVAGISTSYDLALDSPDVWLDTKDSGSGGGSGVGSGMGHIEEGKIYFLPVTRSRHRNPDEEDFTFGFEVRGLVVAPVVSKNSSGCYVRRGCMKLYAEAAELVLEIIAQGPHREDALYAKGNAGEVVLT